MTCYHPIPAFQSNPGGEIRIMPPLGTANFALPCGKCLGCKTDRATVWAQRCSQEASLWPYNSFLTLTYDDEHIPKSGHLEPRQLQLFLKRLRRRANSPGNRINSDRNSNIRFFACGEYGEIGNRPHYHALTFNCEFADRRPAARNLYESDTLNELWPFGANRIGSCTAASAAYIAQYTLKKQNSDDYADRYDPDTREIVWEGKPPPFLRMSRRPAIGKDWLLKYGSDLQYDYIVDDTRKHKIPRYYHDVIKEQRKDIAVEIEIHRAAAQRILLDRHREEQRTEHERLRAAEAIHTRRKQLSSNRR